MATVGVKGLRLRVRIRHRYIQFSGSDKTVLVFLLILCCTWWLSTMARHLRSATVTAKCCKRHQPFGRCHQPGSPANIRDVILRVRPHYFIHFHSFIDYYTQTRRQTAVIGEALNACNHCGHIRTAGRDDSILYSFASAVWRHRLPRTDISTVNRDQWECRSAVGYDMSGKQSRLQHLQHHWGIGSIVAAINHNQAVQSVFIIFVFYDAA